MLKAFVLVSIGNRLFTKDWLAHCLVLVPSECKLTLILMDRPERLNLMVFDGLDEHAALISASEKTEYLINSLGLDKRVECDVWYWDAVAALPQYGKYMTAISSLYEANLSFQRHCRNQVYSNLLPRLRSAGILTKSDHRITALVPYLLEELAGKLCAIQEMVFDTEILLCAEMDIMKAIYAGKYEALNRYVHRKPLDKQLAPHLVVVRYCLV